MLLNELVEVSAQVAATRARLKKIEALAGVLERLEPGEIPIAVAYLSASYPTRRSASAGRRFAIVLPRRRRRPCSPCSRSTLPFGGSGDDGPGLAGGAAGRAGLHLRLERRNRSSEFLARLLTGELRQGALQAVMADALAKAAGVPAATVRRSLMLAGDLGAVAAAALTRASEGLASVRG